MAHSRLKINIELHGKFKAELQLSGQTDTQIIVQLPNLQQLPNNNNHRGRPGQPGPGGGGDGGDDNGGGESPRSLRTKRTRPNAVIPLPDRVWMAEAIAASANAASLSAS